MQLITTALEYLAADNITASCASAHTILVAEGGVCVKCEGGCRFKFITSLPSARVEACSGTACVASATVK